MAGSTNGKTNRIGRRITRLNLLSGFSVLIGLALAQVFLGYRQHSGELERVLDAVAIYTPTIAASVRTEDKIRVELALRALVEMPYIERASILVNGPERRWSVGVNRLSERIATRKYPLIHRSGEQDETVGTLEVVADLDEMYLTIGRHVLEVLVSTVLLVIGVLTLMHRSIRRLVTERLEAVAEKVLRLVPEDLPGESADWSQLGKDEIDALEHTLTGMHVRLKGLVEELAHNNASLRFEIAERRRAEEALKKGQQHLEEQVRERAAQIVAQKQDLQQTLTELELVLENASLGIVTLVPMEDGRRVIQKSNRTAASMLGYTVEEIEGLDARAFIADYGDDFPDSAYVDILTKGGSCRAEHRLLRKDGETIDVWAVGTAIDPGDLSKGVIWLVDDITARKLAEKMLAQAKEAAENALLERENTLLELNKTIDVLRETQRELIERENLAALGALVAGVAHELETPISNTLMSASTLAELTAKFNGQLSQGVKRSSLESYLEAAEQSADIAVRSMGRALELLQGFRRVAVDRGSSMRRSFLLDQVVSEILLVLRPTIKRKPYVIDCNIGEKIEKDSFPGPLGQVLTNLINNALLHAFDGRDHGTLHIEARRLEADRVELQFCDDGVGIAKAHLDHIFEPFFSTKHGRGGSGLGLSIVRNLVTGVLGGTLSVVSEEGQGTTFTLILPVKAPEPAVDGDGSEIPALASLRQDGLR